MNTDYSRVRSGSRSLPSRWIWAALGIAAGLVAFGIPASLAQAVKDSPLPQITVTGDALHRGVDDFITKATDAYVGSEDAPLARWRRPVCPLVAGLPREDGQMLFDRFSSAMQSVGIPLGVTGCRPNFFIVVTAQPERLLKAWWDENFNVFGGGAQGVRHFIATPQPVRIWYNAELIDENGPARRSVGLVVGARGGDGDGIPFYRIATMPNQEFSAVPDLLSVIAVVDLTQVMGLDWRQVADYVAMAGSTKLALQANLGNAPTILRLFSSDPNDRPQRLSAWDKSFIQALYRTDPMLRHQRKDVANLMYRDLSP